ncbi:MAG: type II toxin-antitoxin system death-on-curing family toxin [Thermotogota bacterium]|nr:type II toxin-antitoxin system death-on-curing family toxin [Thermotogota bacterium]
MRFLSLSDVLYINRVVIERYGGRFVEPDNINNIGSLEWALYVMQNPFFYDVNQYPTLGHKAAVLAWSINNGHVFYDGNKRTSIVASLTFLGENSHTLEAGNDDLIKISLSVANREKTGIDLEDLCDWYCQRIISINGSQL